MMPLVPFVLFVSSVLVMAVVLVPMGLGVWREHKVARVREAGRADPP